MSLVEVFSHESSPLYGTHVLHTVEWLVDPFEQPFKFWSLTWYKQTFDDLGWPTTNGFSCVEQHTSCASLKQNYGNKCVVGCSGGGRRLPMVGCSGGGRRLPMVGCSGGGRRLPMVGCSGGGRKLMTAYCSTAVTHPSSEQVQYDTIICPAPDLNHTG